VFVISRVADDAMVTEVQMWSVRVSGWNANTARALAPLAEIVAVPDTAFDGAALLVSDAGTGFEKIKKALIQALKKEIVAAIPDQIREKKKAKVLTVNFK